MQEYICYFDGATRPNPGDIGLGVVLVDINGKEVMSASVSGGYGTNNCGEYRALILAMELALENGFKKVLFVGDSQLVVYQVMGVWGVNNDDLRLLQERAQSLGQKFEWCSVKWVKRTSNSRADELSKAGIGRQHPLISFNTAEIQSDELVLGNKVNSVDLNQAGPTINEQVNTITSADKAEDVQNPKVIVRRLAGNKISFTYLNDVVILDLSKNHCSCKTFAYSATCEHLQAARKILKSAS